MGLTTHKPKDGTKVMDSPDAPSMPISPRQDTYDYARPNNNETDYKEDIDQHVERDSNIRWLNRRVGVRQGSNLLPCQ